MTIEQAKQIAIADYLASFGIFPTRQQNNSLWYLSPFRQEAEPSFKVNPHLNRWIDFGTDEKGDIINLAMKMQGTDSVAYTLHHMSEQSSVIVPNSFSFRKQDSIESFRNIMVKPLGNPALLQYLEGRNIPASLAGRYCEEVYYQCKGKTYFAIAFRNEKGGYETNNPYFKGCISPKAETVIGNGKDTCCVFEGFIDLLSYFVLKLRHANNDWSILKERDYIVLNSVSNTSKAMEHLGKYAQIYCYLDNDTGGAKATEEIRRQYGLKVSDQSVNYRGYKDVSDFLCGKKLAQSTNQVQEAKQVSPPVKKKSRGFRM